eukprot:5314223-Amphidinium_carterae.1
MSEAASAAFAACAASLANASRSKAADSGLAPAVAGPSLHRSVDAPKNLFHMSSFKSQSDMLHDYANSNAT